jgi:hypothetical protein
MLINVPEFRCIFKVLLLHGFVDLTEEELFNRSSIAFEKRSKNFYSILLIRKISLLSLQSCGVASSFTKRGSTPSFTQSKIEI